MKSDARFVFQIYLPPFIAAAYLIAWNRLIQFAEVVPLLEKDDPVNPLPLLPWFIGAVVLLTFIYATVMEMAYDTRLRSNSWMAVLFSEIMGLFAGLAIGWLLSGVNKLFDQTFTYGIVGLATGMTIGMFNKMVFSKPKITLPMELQTN